MKRLSNEQHKLLNHLVMQDPGPNGLIGIITACRDEAFDKLLKADDYHHLVMHQGEARAYEEFLKILVDLPAIMNRIEQR